MEERIELFKGQCYYCEGELELNLQELELGWKGKRFKCPHCGLTGWVPKKAVAELATIYRAWVGLPPRTYHTID